MEIKSALGHVKSGGAGGPDDITTEIIGALEEWGLYWLTRLLRTEHDIGEMPPDLFMSVFVAISIILFESCHRDLAENYCANGLEESMVRVRVGAVWREKMQQVLCVC